MSKRRALTNIKQIIIHCADTPNGRVNTAADIDRWHIARGFHRSNEFIDQDNPLKAIGYHFVIDIDGSIENGRKLCEVGAHCYGHNHDSIGICLIGRDKFTLAQWQALKHKVARLKNDFSLDKIVGHYQYNKAKTCPCFDVPAWLDSSMAPSPLHLLKG